ncbi:MAG TPA: EamA family transporter, partial [Gammaproteobacteria bacterium]|nr:EamA family transporter [Gammaproteobacteria bacterium]
MDWLPLTLICAFMLASADAATKRYLADYTALELTVTRFVFTGLLLAPLLFIQPLPSLPWPFWGWLAVLLPLEILAMLLYMRAI